MHEKHADSPTMFCPKITLLSVFFFQNYFWTTAHHSDEGVRPDELEAASAHGWGSTEKAEAEGEGAKAAVSCDRFR